MLVPVLWTERGWGGVGVGGRLLKRWEQVYFSKCFEGRMLTQSRD